jgi:hypothetical protein
MDPSLVSSDPGGLVGWFMNYGSIAFFFVQVLYWAILATLAFYAVWQFKRWVNFQLGTGRSGKLREDSPSADEKVAVEEFVD